MNLETPRPRRGGKSPTVSPTEPAASPPIALVETAREEQALKKRLQSLRKMKADACDDEDKIHLEGQIAAVAAKLTQSQPLPDRLATAQAQMEEAIQRLKRNRDHVQRAKDSLRKAKERHEAAVHELETVQMATRSCRSSRNTCPPPSPLLLITTPGLHRRAL